jgi:hypothetical protein
VRLSRRKRFLPLSLTPSKRKSPLSRTCRGGAQLRVSRMRKELVLSRPSGFR